MSAKIGKRSLKKYRHNLYKSKKMLHNTDFYPKYLQISGKAVPLHCVFHSIRFKVNKGWSKALLLFLCPYVSFIEFSLSLPSQKIVKTIENGKQPTSTQ
jgi:hypothetical protein